MDFMVFAKKIELDLKIASIVDDGYLVEATRNEVRDLLAADPALANHPVLADYLQHSKSKMQWSKIS